MKVSNVLTLIPTAIISLSSCSFNWCIKYTYQFWFRNNYAHKRDVIDWNKNQHLRAISAHLEDLKFASSTPISCLQPPELQRRWHDTPFLAFQLSTNTAYINTHTNMHTYINLNTNTHIYTFIHVHRYTVKLV